MKNKETLDKFDNITGKINETVEDMLKQTEEFSKQVDQVIPLFDHARWQLTRGEYRDREK